MTTIKIFAIVALSMAVLGCVSAQVTFPGSCPTPPVVGDFDVESYLGLWYEAQKYPNVFEVGGKCITAEYSLNTDGSVKVVNSQVGSKTGEANSIEGRATVVENGKLNVNFPGSPETPSDVSNYWVLDTDYKTYSVVFSCSPIPKLNIQFVWILTRERSPAPEVIARTREVLKQNNISLTPLIVTDQSNC